MGAWVKENEADNEDHEAERLLDAWLHHVEAEHEKRTGGADEKIVLVLPDAVVHERTRNAVPPTKSGGPKKRAKAGR
jgi:hypothetical protein